MEGIEGGTDGEGRGRGKRGKIASTRRR